MLCSASPGRSRYWCKALCSPRALRPRSRPTRTFAPSIWARRLTPMVSNSAEVLTIEGLHAGYGDTVVLEDLNFTFGQGGTLAVIARNGVGKSTLLSTIMGH